MAKRKYENIDYENISMDDLVQEVLRRPRATFQMALNRFKTCGTLHLVEEIKKARKLAQIVRLEAKLIGNK